MFKTIANHWWLTALRGVFAVLFGLATFFWPGATLSALVLLFGFYVLFDGVVALATSLSNWRDKWWLLSLEGIIGIVVGVITFVWPAITAVTLVYLIATWALITGTLEIAAAIQLRREIDNEWVLGLSGIASIIFGLLVFIWPGAGTLAILWMIGAYALLFGGLLIYLGIRLRQWNEEEATRIDMQYA